MKSYQPQNRLEIAQKAVSVTQAKTIPSGSISQGDGQPVPEVPVIMSQTLENCSSSSIELPLLYLNMIECSSVPMASTSSGHDIRNTRLLDCDTSLRLCKQLFNVRYETGYDVPLLRHNVPQSGHDFDVHSFQRKAIDCDTQTYQ